MNKKIDAFDVVILTWNSEETLNNTISSIKKNLKLNRIILIDRFSKDRTIEIAKKHDVILHQNDLDLAHARRYGIQQVETEWFAFIDSDVVIKNENLLDEFSKFSKINNVGWIQSSVLPLKPHWQYIYRKHQHKSKLKSKLRSNIKVNKFDYGCLCTLIKTKAARDWIPPYNFIGAGEDKLLGRHVCLIKGYNSIKTKTYVLHYMSDAAKKPFWNGSGARRIGYYNILDILKLLIGSFPYSLWASIATRCPLIIPKYLKWRFNYLRGWLKPKKYETLDRNELEGD